MLILTSTSSAILRGKASEVETGLSVGINLLQEEESDETACSSQTLMGEKS